MIANGKRHKPITVPRDTVIKTEEAPFLLREEDFLRLTKIHGFVSIWAHTFFAGTGVFLVTLIAKLVDNKFFGAPNGVTSFDWITLSILTVLVVAFEGLHLWLPSEKKKIMRRIQKHFDTYRAS